MTYLIIFAVTLSTMFSTTDASKPIVFKKSQQMLLSPDYARWLKAEASPAWMLEIEGVTNAVTIKRPYSFFIGKVGKGQLVFVLKDVKAKRIKLTPKQIAKIFGEDSDEETDNFEVIETIGQNGETDLAYCSCGGATTSKEGDACFFYEDTSGIIECGGECSGEQSNYDCGVTMVDFTPGGSGPKKVRMN